MGVEAPGTDAAHYSCLMQQGLDKHAMWALMMQSLALEQPVELGLALRSVGAEVEASDLVHRTTCAFGLPSANAALERAGRPALRTVSVLKSRQSVYAAMPTHHLLPADWSEAGVREWRQQREREVEEQQQRAAAEYTASLRERLGNALDLPLLTGGDDGINQAWLANTLGWVCAFVG